MREKKRGELRRSSRSHVICMANALLLGDLIPISAWAGGYDGHKIVAVIAADNLTPAAQSHVARILGVPVDKNAIAGAMETASTIPDSKFREEDSATAPWHFINICLQDQRRDVAARCPRGNC